MSIKIGAIQTPNNVFLAPMSGVTDEAFRAAAHNCGAGLVVSEMVASDALVQERKDMVRRARGAKKLSPFVMQLAGREAHWMAEGARVAQDMGADVIDINMGCPARQVTGGLSGSALMRNLDHAITLVEATVGASKVPVTLKMRLGWDDNSLNAPELAARAEQAGVQMITVHGRTRCQFYTGKADWAAIRAVRAAIKIPLVANGDCKTATDAKAMLEASGADAVMVGRAAYGRPWWPGQMAQEMNPQPGFAPLSHKKQAQVFAQLHNDTIELYGANLGNKTFRKHLSSLINHLLSNGQMTTEAALHFRTQLLTTKNNRDVQLGIEQIFADLAPEKEHAA